MTKLKIAESLSLPLDAVTQTIAILAKRRAGKSYTMRRFIEQLFKAGQQVVIVDPKGDQWGVRSAADGKGPGLAIVILGGERGDVPLEASGGEVVAKLVVEERVSVLLDISLFRKHEVATFMTAFLENLYRLKAREMYRTPVMLVIDEADAVAPQKPQKGEERMLGAAEDIVRRGGQRGIGCVLVTQRSAVLNKNVLTQAQMLVALRTIAPQDLAAMQAWIDVHGTDEQRKTLMESLPSLPIGDAWFWSPGWPTTEGIFKRVHVLPIETFDSGATPEPGEKRVEPKRAADVDLDALQRQMAATIEKAKADDPRELKRRIAELEKQLRERPAVEPERIEVPVLKNGQLDKALALTERLASVERQVHELGAGLTAAIGAATKPAAGPSRPSQHAPPRQAAKPPPQREPRPAAAVLPAGDVTGPEQKILDALAWLESIGIAQPENGAVAFVAGYSPTSTGYTNPRGYLRKRDYIRYLGDDRIQLTEEGRTRATAPEATLDVKALHAKVLGKLPGPEARILRPCLDAYPNVLTNEACAEQAGYSSTSTGYTNPRGNLRKLGLIEYRDGGVVARSILFLE